MGPLRLNQDLLSGGQTVAVTKVDPAIRIVSHSLAKPEGSCIGKKRKCLISAGLLVSVFVSPFRSDTSLHVLCIV